TGWRYEKRERRGYAWRRYVLAGHARTQRPRWETIAYCGRVTTPGLRDATRPLRAYGCASMAHDPPRDAPPPGSSPQGQPPPDEAARALADLDELLVRIPKAAGLAAEVRDL